MRDRRVRNALARGRAKQHDYLAGALMDQAHKGPIAAIFLLKSRFGYRDGGEADSESRPQVIINLPGALPPSRYIETIAPESLPTPSPKPEEEK